MTYLLNLVLAEKNKIGQILDFNKLLLLQKYTIFNN